MLPFAGDDAVATRDRPLQTSPGVGARILATTQALLRAGAPHVQVRSKDVDDRARLEAATVVLG